MSDDNNIVSFETFAIKKKEQFMSEDEKFIDGIVEHCQMYIFEKCTEKGYPVSSEDERFITDVTIGCNIIKQSIDRIAGITNPLTEDIDDILETTQLYKDPRQIEFDF